MSDASRSTTDHDEIRTWVEARGGTPALIASLGRHEDGVPAVVFPAGPSGEGAVPTTWARWFEVFERDSLAFVRPADVDAAAPFFELAQR
ncbi:hypothetical protein KIN34_11895 [Cellulomonas sp. DKR-3]|uniref:Uncharacterized protein n=1 Tax=Cellulomonas fulva TaxID=2835530 RepID=A0ABS5U0P6_9CELL|nr:hypothetical protein [Cellulomonas fulva]MBT0994983.1 hypothetical protein [Cellulomonas fulva]